MRDNGFFHSLFDVAYFLNADHTLPEPKKEKGNDLPHGLLNIGTFGDSRLPENAESENLQDDDQPFDHDLAEFTPEEVSKLEKELTKLLSKKPPPKVDGEIANLPLDRFMNCPSSLEVDRRISTSLCSNLDDKDDEDDINQTIRVILGRCRDACMESKKKSIGRKSISFLLKKMFVCRSGFAFTPNLRDTPQESRMEKLLRTMLKKKVERQNSSRGSSMKKYIEDRRTSKVEKEDETDEASNVQGNKWVKTDSEYIVLEI
ncbi:protein DEEPER ROOTING 1-like [Apium graveolens]|uniref:protein DEEPER ROOTING 1-like n=1 Tax=Apium graveolens TaxID=4045 RepID=UPI003D7B37EC